MLVEAPDVLKAEVALLPDAGILEVDDGEPGKFLTIDGGGHLCLFHAETSSETEFPAAVVPLGLEGFDRLEAVHRLLASLHQRAIPPDTRLTPQQRLRIGSDYLPLSGRDQSSRVLATIRPPYCQKADRFCDLELLR